MTAGKRQSDNEKERDRQTDRQAGRQRRGKRERNGEVGVEDSIQHCYTDFFFYHMRYVGRNIAGSKIHCG